jgi:hypothetical protein
MTDLRILILGVFALLLACGSDNGPVAGGEDFPNSATAAIIGQHLATALGSGGDWNAFDSILDTIPDAEPAAAVIETVLIAGRPMPDSLGTPMVTTGAIWDDTAAGLLRRWTTRDYQTASVTVYDTTVIAYDDNARDTILANDLVLAIRGLKLDLRTGTATSYATIDTDGNGSFDSCAYRYEAPCAAEDTDVIVLAFDAGPGGNIATLADNRVTEWRQFTTNGADTVRAMWFADGDSGRGLFAFGQTDSAHVLFVSYVKPDTGRVVRRDQWARLVYYTHSGATVYPVAYRGLTQFRDGSRIDVRVVGPAADSTFAPGDTVTIVRTLTAADSSEETAHFTVGLGLRPADYRNARLVRYVAANLSRPPLTHVSFACTPQAAVAAGDTLTGGTFALTGLLDGTAFSVEGTFTATTVSGTYRDAAGHQAVITWDRGGTVIVSR